MFTLIKHYCSRQKTLVDAIYALLRKQVELLDKINSLEARLRERVEENEVVNKRKIELWSENHSLQSQLDNFQKNLGEAILKKILN